MSDVSGVVIEDTQSDPSVAEVRAALAELGIGAHLFLPLARNGGPRVALSVQQITARRWAEEELVIAREVSGRAWAEVERARAEAGLARARPGRLNWGLVAIAKFGLVDWIFGEDFGGSNAASRIVYGLVGLDAIYRIASLLGRRSAGAHQSATASR